MGIVWPLWQLGLAVRHEVAYAAIALGLFSFVASTMTWFAARLSGRPVASSRLYRLSRHPQYLGWILGTWAMMILAGIQPIPMGGENPEASLPWVVATLVIVGVAWAEEAKMVSTRGADYLHYRDTTPSCSRFPRPSGMGVGADPPGHPQTRSRDPVRGPGWDRGLPGAGRPGVSAICSPRLAAPWVVGLAHVRTERGGPSGSTREARDPPTWEGGGR